MISARSPWRSARTACSISSIDAGAGVAETGLACCAAAQAIAETLNSQTAVVSARVLRTCFSPDRTRDCVVHARRDVKRPQLSTRRAGLFRRQTCPEVIEPVAVNG